MKTLKTPVDGKVMKKLFKKGGKAKPKARLVETLKGFYKNSSKTKK